MIRKELQIIEDSTIEPMSAEELMFQEEAPEEKMPKIVGKLGANKG
jgi:hypothetical protein